ncbi:acyltransferase family protein [Maribacter sp. ANRC-HE7]|uniref:Acyltransferase family protein n=2 Tax=Maribacter aquimaris TaxID=2737171 RepID=A0ABR7V1W7_9FLAO|nr:acyltransferase family protein [Maribacter aquimaris]
MMMLGIVLHSIITYDTIIHPGEWLLKDIAYTSNFMTWLYWLIHIFRMPIFFIVTGFFGALLFYERSPEMMIKNRIKRVLFPFILFLFLLWPPMLFTFTYTNLVFSGTENALSQSLNAFGELSDFLPSTTMHLWFLYYLMLFVFTSFGLGMMLKKLPRLSTKINYVFHLIVEKPYARLLMFSAITFGLLLVMNQPWVSTSTYFKPSIKTFVFYFVFYLFGWLLFKSKGLLKTFMQYDFLSTIFGILLLTVSFLYKDKLSVEVIMALNALTVWSLSFGITGLFVRYGSEHSQGMRYISDASYWVYLIHLPFTQLIPGMIADWNFPPPLKALVVLTTTSMICFISYHYLVRNTFIGKFLNGKKYPIKTYSLGQIKEILVRIWAIRNY